VFLIEVETVMTSSKRSAGPPRAKGPVGYLELRAELLVFWAETLP
jgi:hypothetical protein